MRAVRVLLTTAGLTAAALTAPAAAAPLPLPPPGAAAAQDTDLCAAVGCLPDRLLTSVVPGPVRNDEVVLVGLDGGGAPVRVEVEQRLLLNGRGDYQVRERGPARRATSLSELDPPVTKFGAVVWQGFSPGERELAARLLLDVELEAPRLPLQLEAVFTPRGGQPGPLAAGGLVDGPGRLVLRLLNRTAQPADLPTAADADPAVLAGLLGRLQTAASRAAGPRLPAVGTGLPAAVEATAPGVVSGERSVPLRVSGTLRADEAVLSGPGTTPDGAVTGTLSAGTPAEVALDVTAPGVVVLDLTAVPVLDARLLAPAGAPDWPTWLAQGPDVAERRQALAQLVAAAATGARAASFSPYLGADLPGTGTTSFRFSFTAPEAVAEVAPGLDAEPLALAVTGLAVLLLLGNGALLWARS